MAGMTVATVVMPSAVAIVALHLTTAPLVVTMDMVTS